MTDRQHVDDLLPWYVNDTLQPDEHLRVAAHLETCDACAAALVDWRLVAHAVREAAPASATQLAASPQLVHAPPAPSGQPQTSLAGTRLRQTPGELVALTRVQARLLPWGLWRAVLIVLALGVLIVLAGDWSGRIALGLLAPLAAAASVSLTCTPDNDPRLDVALASPISARLVLLTRLTIVLGYDLLLALIASAALILAGNEPLNALLGAWLAPMFGLSCAALLATIVLDPGIAMAFAFGLWALRWLAPVAPSTPLILAIGAICLAAAATRIQRATT